MYTYVCAHFSHTHTQCLDTPSLPRTYRCCWCYSVRGTARPTSWRSGEEDIRSMYMYGLATGWVWFPFPPPPPPPPQHTSPPAHIPPHTSLPHTHPPSTHIPPSTHYLMFCLLTVPSGLPMYECMFTFLCTNTPSYVLTCLPMY